ncbi:aldehyde dehydrogenase family protein [Nesterenkonia haasae]|uniref:aldehyde dehydrogenase family protein n=1 Tax=Nesterenkonia haasae TaxID=2587813 RepID=UPI001390B513|nr:aldehyde dehydrogenase family protein [Nesterenkonia haasae]NDK31955.1 aldehyde dehydrogenase family protein [Nesterenkonia haasae]
MNMQHAATPERAHQLAADAATQGLHLIGGELVPGTTPATIRAPWDLSLSVEYQAVGAEAARRAIAAASNAFAADTGDRELRQRVLLAMAERAEAIEEELAMIISFENGKLLRSARMEATAVSMSFRYWAHSAPQNEVLSSDELHVTELQRKPLGVVVAITPFNMPVLMMANKIGAALTTGNTVVAKPSPATPLAALRLARAIADVVPEGWVNIIAGTEDTGPVLSESPEVALVSFTGSVPVGRTIMASAASSLTRVQLELGGNDPAIIGPDADLDTVVPKIFTSAFGSSGQACVAAKRVYAPEGVAGDVTNRLVALARETKIGHPFDPEATAPVLTTRAQYEKIELMLEEAHSAAEVVFEGKRDSARGYYVHPSIVVSARPGASVVDDEQFGPILPVVPYSSTQEVIEMANSTPFGLGATVWSPDQTFLDTVVPRLHAGTVWVNGLGRPSPAVPFGGAKQSGIGREGGRPGLDDMSELVTVTHYTTSETAASSA